MYFYSPDQGVIKSFKLPANFYLLKVEKLDTTPPQAANMNMWYNLEAWVGTIRSIQLKEFCNTFGTVTNEDDRKLFKLETINVYPQTVVKDYLYKLCYIPDVADGDVYIIVGCKNNNHGRYFMLEKLSDMYKSKFISPSREHSKVQIGAIHVISNEEEAKKNKSFTPASTEKNRNKQASREKRQSEEDTREQEAKKQKTIQVEEEETDEDGEEEEDMEAGHMGRPPKAKSTNVKEQLTLIRNTVLYEERFKNTILRTLYYDENEMKISCGIVIYDRGTKTFGVQWDKSEVEIIENADLSLLKTLVHDTSCLAACGTVTNYIGSIPYSSNGLWKKEMHIVSTNKFYNNGSALLCAYEFDLDKFRNEKDIIDFGDSLKLCIPNATTTHPKEYDLQSHIDFLDLKLVGIACEYGSGQNAKIETLTHVYVKYKCMWYDLETFRFDTGFTKIQMVDFFELNLQRYGDLKVTKKDYIKVFEKENEWYQVLPEYETDFVNYLGITKQV